jgi:hypothetical protein
MHRFTRKRGSNFRAVLVRGRVREIESEREGDFCEKNIK